MGKQRKETLIQELKQQKVLSWYWSEKMEKVLTEEIVLDYETVGDLGIYSKYYEFCIPYAGQITSLIGTEARIRIGITANTPKYDINKAIEGTDCYHNVLIVIYRNHAPILSVRFRLWSGEKAEYSGNESLLNDILQS